jgi:urease alpha subunit
MTDKAVPEIFTDGIGRCRYGGGVVRMDLISASEADEKDAKEAKTVVTNRLIMSPEGFLRAVSTMNTLLNQLVKAGVVKQERRQKPDTDGT